MIWRESVELKTGKKEQSGHGDGSFPGNLPKGPRPVRLPAVSVVSGSEALPRSRAAKPGSQERGAKGREEPGHHNHLGP